MIVSPIKRPPDAPSDDYTSMGTAVTQSNQYDTVHKELSPDALLSSRAPIVICGGGLSDLGGLIPLSGGSCSPNHNSPITLSGDYLSPGMISPHCHGFSQPSTCSSSEAYKGILLFSPDALRNASPSRKDKMTDTTEDRAVVRHADFVDKVCQRVWTDYCIPANSIGISLDDFYEIRATAMWYCHLFYAVHSLKRYGWRPVVLAATFLAYKSCERSPIRLRMNQLLDCYEKLERQPRYTTQRALQKMAQDVCETEEAIMCLTGFEFDLNLPHKHVNGIVGSITSDGEVRKRLQQKAIGLLNDAFRGRSVLFYPGDVLAFAAVSEAASTVLDRDSTSWGNLERKLAVLREEMRHGFDVDAVVSSMHSHEPGQRRRSSIVQGGSSSSSSSAADASSPSVFGIGESLGSSSSTSRAVILTPKCKRKRGFVEEPSSEPSTLTALDLALAREMPPAQCTRAAIARRRMLLMGGDTCCGNTVKDAIYNSAPAPRKRRSKSSQPSIISNSRNDEDQRRESILSAAAAASSSPTKRYRVTVA